MAVNTDLQKAKINKNDEFYTQYSDIQAELDNYKAYYKDSIVFCNCDDPTWSNFWRYFHLNFKRFKLKKLISTHYDRGNPSYKMEYYGGNDEDIEAGIKTPLEGDGDFRSPECLAILEEADIVASNPPFSLFIPYVKTLMDADKKIAIIGNMNSITCKDIFPLFRDNLLWYGNSIHSGDRKFNVPDDYPLDAAGCGVDENGKKYIRVKGVRWFTNLKSVDRIQPLKCEKKYSAQEYPILDNYNAINVNKTADIPANYDGEMAVPISFMDKYSSDQFEIVGISGDLAKKITLPNGKRGSGRFYLNGKRLYDRIVIKYTDEWKAAHPSDFDKKYFNINNRRYTGSKHKLMPWIKDIITQYCPHHSSLFDVFGGTGVVTAGLLNTIDRATINDFLFSNKVIYKAFFGKNPYDQNKLDAFKTRYASIDKSKLANNYVSDNYGDKYFAMSDAKIIGFIRQNIEDEYLASNINDRERCILIASLLYSFDRCANTVGHYEAYIKGKPIRTEFRFELIKPISTNVEIDIYREDSNVLAPKINADIAFIDPPYNSRQYSRFYHVLETITKWDKPDLSGVAMKPPEENMSDYCRNSAAEVFTDLINKLKVKYILVTYNNTYNSKSGSSQNKITLEQIREILSQRGQTIVFSKNYHRFNAGKTDKTDHKEYVFFTTIEEDNKNGTSKI